MNIAVQLKSFAYYHQKGIIYVSGFVIEKKILNETHFHINHFKTVENGGSISLKYNSGIEVETVLSCLRERVLKFSVIDIDQPRDSKDGVKFVFDRVQECAILTDK